MDKAVEGCNGGISSHILMQMPGISRDLLQNFINGTNFPKKLEEGIEKDEEVELTLGLSLNGRFGVDPSAKKLVRSSSIPEFFNPLTGENAITRTCSLPMENEDECRKRKAMQSLRRMEAKRKRMEKQRNSRAANCQNGRVSTNGQSDEDRKIPEGSSRNHGKDRFLKGSCDVSVAKEETCGMPNRSCDVKGADLKGGNTNNDTVASQGSRSSEMLEFESSAAQGSDKCAEVRSPSAGQTLPDGNQKSPSVTPTTPLNSSNSSAPTTGSAKDERPASNGVNGMVRNVLMDMPCVLTTGEGPDGKRIEGFLYRYKKGEEVKIVCVCHGKFLSPAEFVKHAGGGEVSHPLKHIVVNASPFFQ